MGVCKPHKALCNLGEPPPSLDMTCSPMCCTQAWCISAWGELGAVEQHLVMLGAPAFKGWHF